MGRKVVDMIGQRFGRWLVLARAKNRGQNIYYLCRCDCGEFKVISGNSLRIGKSQSCGCLRKEIISEANKDKPKSKEHCKKISESRMGKYCGKDSPNYNPNLTDEERIVKRNYPEYTNWRKAVYERDNYTCQKCNISKSGNLNAHHIESYDNNPEFRTNISNGITLCKKHHKDFHHQYGWGNNTREQLEEFLNNSPKGL